MKKRSATFLTPVSSDVLSELTTVVSETAANDIKETNRAAFSAVDLWKIHRHKRPVGVRDLMNRHQV